MIGVLLRDMRWRFLLLLVVWLGFLLWEIEAHEHGALEGVEAAAVSLGAPMAYIASIGMIVLLAGFISRDRREGYTRLYFSHPASPLALYGLRWVISFLVVTASSVLFLVAAQLAVWGEFRGGWAALMLPVLTALIFGGLITFLSAALPRGDGWVAALLFVPTLIPQVFAFLLQSAPTALREVIYFVLPPQTTALQSVYENLLVGQISWAGVLFALGYGLVWLGGGWALLRVRDWP